MMAILPLLFAIYESAFVTCTLRFALKYFLDLPTVSKGVALYRVMYDNAIYFSRDFNDWGIDLPSLYPHLS